MKQERYDRDPVVDARSVSSGKRTSNLILKIASLLMAVGIWFYAMSVNNPSSEAVITDIPVQVVNLYDESITVTADQPLCVDVTVTGKKKDLDKLTADDFTVQADASGISGVGKFTLHPSVTAKPTGVTVVSCTEALAARLDFKATAEIPVSVNLTGWSIDDNLEKGDSVPEVETVSVTGPSTLLAEIKCARVTVEPGNLTGSIRVSGRVELIGQDDRVMRDSNLTCAITDIAVRIPVYAYRDLPLTVDCKYGYYTDSNTAITLSPSTVRVKGDPADLESVSEISVGRLDETKITEDTVTMPISLPDGLINVSGTDSTTVSINHKNTVLRSFYVQNIIINHADGMQYNLITTGLNVRIRTTADDASLISAENISVVADVSEIVETTGRMQVPVTVAINTDTPVWAYAVGEYQITVDFGK